MKFESEDIRFTPITFLLSEVVDNRGRTCPTAETGIPLIATNCIGHENLYPTKKNIRHISLETYNSWFRGHPEPGDIIFVNKGTPGRVCLVPDPVDFCIAQDMVSLRVNEQINNLYLLAALRSPQVRNQIQQMQVGTMIPHFKKGDFDNLLIPMRDMPTQKAIGKIYFELSKKIEVNSRLSKTLEEIAQTIFKSWFIDFNPVKAKMAGEKPVGMDAATAALFPDSMEDSELGLTPKGWSGGNLGHILDIFDSRRVPLSGAERKKRSGLFPYYGAAGVIDFIDDYLFTGPHVLVGEDGTVVTSQGKPVVQYVWGNFWVSNHAHVLKGNAGISVEYLKLLLDRIDISNFITGAVQPKLSQGNLKAVRCIMPSRTVLEGFDVIIQPVFESIRILKENSKTLVEIRDSLLPRLISGELQIPKEMLAS
jgi:type I restriction enzyme S subunit